MASDRWKESSGKARPPAARGGDPPPPGGGIPDFVRRALTAGFSGFFLTGEALREALGDSLPKEWADFASEQSARARTEFIDRLGVEVGRALDGIDWAEVLAKLFEGRSLEVNARVRLVESDEGHPSALRIRFEDDD